MAIRLVPPNPEAVGRVSTRVFVNEPFQHRNYSVFALVSFGEALVFDSLPRPDVISVRIRGDTVFPCLGTTFYLRGAGTGGDTVEL